MSDYPEHDKLKNVKDMSQTVGEFIDWLGEKGFTICIYSSRAGMFMPASRPIENWLAEFFNIDLTKIDEEKRQMLEKIREES